PGRRPAAGPRVPGWGRPFSPRPRAARGGGPGRARPGAPRLRGGGGVGPAARRIPAVRAPALRGRGKGGVNLCPPRPPACAGRLGPGKPRRRAGEMTPVERTEVSLRQEFTVPAQQPALLLSAGRASVTQE